MADENVTGAEDGPFNKFLGGLDCLRSELEEEKSKLDDIQKLLCQEQEADVEGQWYNVRKGRLELVGGSEFNGYGSEEAPLKSSTPEHRKGEWCNLWVTQRT